MNPIPSDYTNRTPLSLDEQKRIELDILKTFDAFCRAHSLRYSINDGTLLGAVRHRGFIPWDDDIDVCMLREDYDRFIRLFTQSPVAPYEIVSGDTNRGYPCNFVKIHDPRTVLFENNQRYSFCGIYIDVFPLDAVSPDPRYRERLSRTLLRCATIQAEKAGCRQTHPNPVKNAVIAIRWFLLKAVPMAVPRAIFEWNVRRAARHSDGLWLGNMSFPKSLRRYVSPRAWFESSISLSFEGLSFPATPHYDEYLTAKYGDYMTPPPPEKQVSWHGPVCYLKNAPEHGGSSLGPLP